MKLSEKSKIQKTKIEISSGFSEVNKRRVKEAELSTVKATG